MRRTRNDYKLQLEQHMNRRDPNAVRLNANYGWMDEDFYLTPGVIDETARWVFTHGHCHSLALAISDVTGWDLVGAFQWDDTPYGGPSHVGILTDAGEVLDIDGRWEPHQWGREYSAQVIDVDYHDALSWDYYREPQIEIAQLWVDPVFHKYGLVRAAHRAHQALAAT